MLEGETAAEPRCYNLSNADDGFYDLRQSEPDCPILPSAETPAELPRGESINSCAQDHCARLHFGAVSYLQREKIGTLEAQLDCRRFTRPHRSVIVNVDRIRELRPVCHGDYVVVLKSGAEIALSRYFRDRFFQRISGALENTITL